MRFLLHASNAASRASTTAVTKTAGSARAQVANAELFWGQRCSPQCGCVLRFESTSDSSTGRIVSAEYHAKSVVTVPQSDGSLRPQLVARGTGGGGGGDNDAPGRPLLTECKCTNLHALALAVTSFLPGRTVHAIRNSAEYDRHRSSDSFRRTALGAQGLPPAAGSCYDLVEEAFLAAMKGYVPSPRQRILVENMERRRGGVDQERRRKNATPGGGEADPLRYVNAARRAGRIYNSGEPKNNMPTYHRGWTASSMVHKEISDNSVAGTTEGSVPASADGMPAFHINTVVDTSPSELMNKYDEVLDELCRDIEGRSSPDKEVSLSVVDDCCEEEEDDDEDDLRMGTTLLGDWVTHVDYLHHKDETKASE